MAEVDELAKKTRDAQRLLWQMVQRDHQMNRQQMRSLYDLLSELGNHLDPRLEHVRHPLPGPEPELDLMVSAMPRLIGLER